MDVSDLSPRSSSSALYEFLRSYVSTAEENATPEASDRGHTATLHFSSIPSLKLVMCAVFPYEPHLSHRYQVNGQSFAASSEEIAVGVALRVSASLKEEPSDQVLTMLNRASFTEARLAARQGESTSCQDPPRLSCPIVKQRPNFTRKSPPSHSSGGATTTTTTPFVKVPLGPSRSTKANTTSSGAVEELPLEMEAKGRLFYLLDSMNRLLREIASADDGKQTALSRVFLDGDDEEEGVQCEGQTSEQRAKSAPVTVEVVAAGSCREQSWQGRRKNKTVDEREKPTPAIGHNSKGFAAEGQMDFEKLSPLQWTRFLDVVLAVSQHLYETLFQPLLENGTCRHDDSIDDEVAKKNFTKASSKVKVRPTPMLKSLHACLYTYVTDRVASATAAESGGKADATAFMTAEQQLHEVRQQGTPAALWVWFFGASGLARATFMEFQQQQQQGVKQEPPPPQRFSSRSSNAPNGHSFGFLLGLSDYLAKQYLKRHQPPPPLKQQSGAIVVNPFEIVKAFGEAIGALSSPKSGRGNANDHSCISGTPKNPSVVPSGGSSPSPWKPVGKDSVAPLSLGITPPVSGRGPGGEPGMQFASMNTSYSAVDPSLLTSRVLGAGQSVDVYADHVVSTFLDCMRERGEACYERRDHIADIGKATIATSASCCAGVRRSVGYLAKYFVSPDKPTPHSARTRTDVAATLSLVTPQPVEALLTGRQQRSHSRSQSSYRGRHPQSLLSRLERDLSSSRYALQFAVKLGTLYATHDINALLQLQPSLSPLSTAAEVAVAPVNRAAMRRTASDASISPVGTVTSYLVPVTSTNPPQSSMYGATTAQSSREGFDNEPHVNSGSAPHHHRDGGSALLAAVPLRTDQLLRSMQRPLLATRDDSVSPERLLDPARLETEALALLSYFVPSNTLGGTAALPSLPIDTVAADELGLCCTLRLIQNVMMAVSYYQAADGSGADLEGAPSLTLDSLFGFQHSGMWGPVLRAWRRTMIQGAATAVRCQHALVATLFLAVLTECDVACEGHIKQGPLTETDAIPRGLGMTSATTSFVIQWVAAFGPIADTTWHLLRCGHRSPKSLEAATWHLAGLAAYFTQLCRAILPSTPMLRRRYAKAVTVARRRAQNSQGKRYEKQSGGAGAVGHASDVDDVEGDGAMEERMRRLYNQIQAELMQPSEQLIFLPLVKFLNDIAVLEEEEERPEEQSVAAVESSAGVYTSSTGGALERGKGQHGAADGIGAELHWDGDEGYLTDADSVSSNDWLTPDADSSVGSPALNSGSRGHRMNEGATAAMEHRRASNNPYKYAREGSDRGGEFTWKDLCVHYFLEIVDVLLHAAWYLPSKPAFLVTSFATLTSSPSQPLWGIKHKASADKQASTSAMRTVQSYVGRHCNRVMQVAMERGFTLSTEDIQGLQAAIADTQAVADPVSDRPRKLTTTTTTVTAATNSSFASPATASILQSNETNGNYTEEALVLEESTGDVLTPTHTMWWPLEGFHRCLHVRRVVVHAQLLTRFLEDANDGSHRDADESESGGGSAGVKNMEDSAKQNSSQDRCPPQDRGCVGPTAHQRFIMTGVSLLLDTANGACTQLLSLPCARFGSSASVSPTLTASAAAAAAAHSATCVPFMALPSSAALPSSSSFTAQRQRQQRSQRSLRDARRLCGDFWLRIQVLRLITFATIPISAQVQEILSKKLKGRQGSPTAAAAAAAEPLDFTRRAEQLPEGSSQPSRPSVLSRNYCTTYVRLLFLRFVQACYSRCYTAPVVTAAAAAGGAGSGSGHHGNISSSSFGTMPRCWTTAATGSGGIDSLHGITQQLWWTYMYELLRALRHLCWHHTEAHRTAHKLAIPSVLARFLVDSVEGSSEATTGTASPCVEGLGGAGSSGAGVRSAENSVITWSPRPVEGCLDDSSSDSGDGQDSTCKAKEFIDFEDEEDNSDGKKSDITNKGTASTLLPSHFLKPAFSATGAAFALPPRPSPPPPMSAGTSASPPPFVVPKLSFVGLRPPLYFTSSGDTGAAQDAIRTKETESVNQSSTPLGVNTRGGVASPLPRLPAPPGLPPIVPKLSFAGLRPPLYFTSSGDTGAAQDAILTKDLGRGDERNATLVSASTSSAASDAAGRAALSSPSPPAFTHVGEGNRQFTTTAGSATPLSHLHVTKQPLSMANSSSQPHRRAASPTGQARGLLPASIAAELVLCLGTQLLQRESGTIMYAYTVSSLTERKAPMPVLSLVHMRQHSSHYGGTAAASAAGLALPIGGSDGGTHSGSGSGGARMAKSSSARSNGSSGSGGIVTPVLPLHVVASGTHGPPAFHVLCGLHSFMRQCKQPAVLDRIAAWAEEHWLTAQRRHHQSSQQREMKDTEEEEGVLLACGLYVLLQLTLPRREGLYGVKARRRLGAGGYGSVLAATYEGGDTGEAAATTAAVSAEQRGERGNDTRKEGRDEGRSAAAAQIRARERQLFREHGDLAIKLMPFQLHGAASELLPVCHSEVLAMYRMQGHPHIVSLLTFGSTDTEFFVVMPHYKGGSLHAWRTSHHAIGCDALTQRITPVTANFNSASSSPGSAPLMRTACQSAGGKAAASACSPSSPLSPSFTLLGICTALFTQVLKAVFHLHRHHIRHGDIKADNLFIDDVQTVFIHKEVSSSVTKRAVMVASSAKPRQYHIPRTIRLGDFGSCDTCEDDDLRALLGDIEGGEARFVAGRWGFGKGTETVQPPELLFVHRRYQVLRGLLEDQQQQQRQGQRSESQQRTTTVKGPVPMQEKTGATAAGASSKERGTGAKASMSAITTSPVISFSDLSAWRGVLRRVELSVDMWACGCLLYEMLTGQALFGEARMNRAFLLATSAVVPFSPSLPGNTAATAPPLTALEDHDTSDLVKTVGEDVVQFMSKLLSVHPMHRPTAKEALNEWKEIVDRHPHLRQ